MISVPDSVATMAKHFPGGGPQLDGEDPHFPYGREQVYPGGRFDDHLVPFRRAIEAGTSALMPYYGMPIGLELDGEAIEEVGFGFNKQILTGLLREQLGYDGVICTDWGLVTGTVVFGRPLPGPGLGGGAPQPAGPLGQDHRRRRRPARRRVPAPSCVLEAVEEGLITSERIDESVRRLLLVKFQLGLFDDPFVDADVAERIVGAEDFRAAGHRAQAESMVLLQNERRRPADAAAGRRA